MARDSRWHTGWILSFLIFQFVFALVVLALNGRYWAKYGGTVHSQLIESGFAAEPPFVQNVKQVTKPLNLYTLGMYIFAISSATIALVALQAIVYFSHSLHPIFTILVNIALFLAWSGCLAVYFVWGGSLHYTGAAWLSKYNSFCNLHNPPVVNSVEYIYTVTCGGEKILIIMLPFICLNILLPPLFSFYALIALILSHRKTHHNPPFPHQPPQQTPPYPPYLPHQQQQQQSQPPISTSTSPFSTLPPPSISSPPSQPQPFVHQGVLYHPVSMVPRQQQHQQQQQPMMMTELSGQGAPTREMAATATDGEAGAHEVRGGV